MPQLISTILLHGWSLTVLPVFVCLDWLSTWNRSMGNSPRWTFRGSWSGRATSVSSVSARWVALIFATRFLPWTFFLVLFWPYIFGVHACRTFFASLRLEFLPDEFCVTFCLPCTFVLQFLLALLPKCALHFLHYILIFSVHICISFCYKLNFSLHFWLILLHSPLDQFWGENSV